MIRGTRMRVVGRAVVAAVRRRASPPAAAGRDSSSTTSSASLTATPTSTSPVDKKVAAQVPSSIKSSGTLSVAADATYAPNEFIAEDGKTVIGMDADLAKAIAQAMGLQAEVKNATFDSIIPGLAANKYDLGMSSFTITKEREKTVDFVSYAIAGTSFFVKADGGPDIQSLADLCGQKVAAERGTTQAADATAQDKKCKAAGEARGHASRSSPTRTRANLALSSGRADVAMADSPPAAYAVEQSDGQFKLTGKQYGTAALRDRDAEGQRPGEARAGRAQGRDGGRHLRPDLLLLGPGEEGGRGLPVHDHEPGDQPHERAGQLAARIRAWPARAARQMR